MNRVDSKSLQLVSRRASPLPETNLNSPQAESYSNKIERKHARADQSVTGRGAFAMAHTEIPFFHEYSEVPACARVDERIFDTSVF